MGNDDALVFGQIAHIRIIDTSCPNQVLAAARWIMEGNKGLVYLRIMRAASPVLYAPHSTFQYGKGYWLWGDDHAAAFLVSSGRGVHEALEAARKLEESGVRVGVVDMPSMDAELIMKLYESGKPVVIEEQNNGFIWADAQSVLLRSQRTVDTRRLTAINTLDESGRPQFIHSATYPQLLETFRLGPEQLTATVRKLLAQT